MSDTGHLTDLDDLVARHKPIHLSDPHLKTEWEQCDYCCKSPGEGWPCDTVKALRALSAARGTIEAVWEALVVVPDRRLREHISAILDAHACSCPAPPLQPCGEFCKYPPADGEKALDAHDIGGE